MCKVLIVDDDKNFVETMACAFKRKTGKGYDVSTATTKQDAIEKLEAIEFDLVVLDLALTERIRNFDSDYEGFEILNVIKNKCLSTMVVIMSVHSEKTRAETLGKGAFDFIDKNIKGINLQVELLQKAKNALIVRKYLKERVESKLDANGYLIISTRMLLDNLKNKGVIKEKDFEDVLNVINKKNEIKEFNKLTNKVSEKFINSNDNLCELLHRLILKNSKLDILLYLTQKRYRDHCKHQFLVGMLGFFLLDVQLPDSETIIEKIRKQTKLSEDEIIKAWWTAALLHDHGYPLSQILKSVFEINKLISIIDDDDSRQVIERMKKVFLTYRNIFSIDFVDELFKDNNNIDNFILKLNTLIVGFFHGIVHDCTVNNSIDKHFFDHGLIGAANIISFLKEKKGDRIANYLKDNLWLQEAILAIKLHNSLDLCKDFNFEKHPIAFLLKLCDELQEWDRMTFNKDDVKADLMVETNYIKLGCFNYSSKKYTLKGERKKGILNAVFEYHDPKVLDKTGWDLGLFEKNKMEHLKSLNLSDSFLSKLNFTVSKLNNVKRSHKYR